MTAADILFNNFGSHRHIIYKFNQCTGKSVKYLCSHTGGGPLAGGANIGRPNWSKLYGGRSTKFGGGRLSGGGGPNGLPKAVKYNQQRTLNN